MPYSFSYSSRVSDGFAGSATVQARTEPPELYLAYFKNTGAQVLISIEHGRGSVQFGAGTLEAALRPYHVQETDLTFACLWPQEN